MGVKFIKKGIAYIIMLCMVSFTFAFSAASVYAEDLVSTEIEQIYTNMPDIHIYIPGADNNTIASEDIVCYFNDNTLECNEVSVFSETNDNADYYVLFDISASITKDKFEDMKSSVIFLEQQLSENDRFTFITFGDEIVTAYKSDEKNTEFSDIVSGLYNDNKSTSLYSALAYVAKVADSNTSDKYKRKECILITDGYDETVGKETMEETQNQLLKYNIPVYSISTIGQQSSMNKQLGELSRMTGADIKIVDDNNTCTDLIKEIVSEINNSLVLSFKADTNIVNNSENQFSIKFKNENITKTKKVFLSRWQPDTTIPEIKKVNTDNTNQLKVYFSEDVENADDARNYTIINSSDEAVNAVGVSYEKKGNEYIATLTFENPIITDTYTVSCKNIYDKSMEENKVESVITQQIDGEAPPNVFVEFIKSWWWIILLFGIIITALILIILFIRKRAIVLNDEDIQKKDIFIRKENKNDTQYQVHIEESEPVEKKMIFMRISLSSGESRDINIGVASNLVVGRSKACGLCVEDPYLARVHFAIEREQDCFYINDLHSTNGTSLNGVKINSRRKLVKNDVISAGTVKFTVYWD